MESRTGAGMQQWSRRRQGAETGEPGDSRSTVRFLMAGERPSDPANAASRSGKTGGGHHESTQPPPAALARYWQQQPTYSDCVTTELHHSQANVVIRRVLSRAHTYATAQPSPLITTERRRLNHTQCCWVWLGPHLTCRLRRGTSTQPQP